MNSYISAWVWLVTKYVLFDLCILSYFYVFNQPFLWKLRCFNLLYCRCEIWNEDDVTHLMSLCVKRHRKNTLLKPILPMSNTWSKEQTSSHCSLDFALQRLAVHLPLTAIYLFIPVWMGSSFPYKNLFKYIYMACPFS